MSNKINISLKEKNLIVYVVLTIVTLAVFWQVNQFDFVNIDDGVYVTENSHLQSGLTLDGFRWAFTTTYAEFWHPLTWLSLMLDYQLFGLNAGGYHMTNLILHILSTLLLFWLFNRMTGALWPSAFVAAFFALHPLHVESVAWIAERKDVLSAFFWMLTLCLYVYYTEKPVISRYFLVLFFFACALMSKSIVVTLPVIMILLDYWPLKRFESKKGDLISWQLKEKIPFFALSAVFSLITIFAQPSVKHLPLNSRIANGIVNFVIYLEKTFWPHDLAFFYPFPAGIPEWKVIGASLLIIVITVAVIKRLKRLPCLFVGWFWYAVTLSPVVGIMQVGNHAMADRYTYLPLTGIGIIVAWGLPVFFQNRNTRKRIMLSSAIAFLTILTILSWKQCSYWKNDQKLFNHALGVTNGNFMAYNCLGIALVNEKKYEKALENCDQAISLRPDYANAYHCRGSAYYQLGQYEKALEDCNLAIRLQPDDSKSYYYKGLTYHQLNNFYLAIENYNKAIQLQPDRAEFYKARGDSYTYLRQYPMAVKDYSRAILIKPDYADAYNNRGNIYYNFGQYQRAIEDYNRAILIKPDYADAYNNRGITYLDYGNKNLGCVDAQKACKLGNCKALSLTKKKGACD
ncbi:MAG: tetratricopeptide repeat protein [Smithella sp.]